MRDNIMHHQMHTLDSPSVITFSTERPRMLVSWSFIAQNAPTESCRCTTRIPWYHQNPAYTHRILFALTAWTWVSCSCGLNAVLPFTGWPLLTGPWLLNSVLHWHHSLQGTRQKWTDLSHHPQLSMCTSRDKMAASGMDFSVLIECEFVAVVSWKVGWLCFFFTQNLHSSDRTTGESVLLVLGLFLPVWDDRTSG